MCAQINQNRPADESSASENTPRESRYRVLRVKRRRLGRSVDREDAVAKTAPEVNHTEGTTGVQVHGMYLRKVLELGRSPEGRCIKHESNEQERKLGFSLYWGRSGARKKTLRIKTAPKKLGKCIEAYTDWIKLNRNRLTTKKAWEQTAIKLTGHYQYYGLKFNRQKLYHFYYTAMGALFKWLNRRSQKHSFDAEKFRRKLRYNPLPLPPMESVLKDITSVIDSTLKRKTPSRMRKSRTSGSYRSRSWQQPLFT